MHGHPYRRLALMTALSFTAMYVLMYAMVNSFTNVLSSLNQVYMAGLMTAPMVIIELVVMWPMYERRLWNALLLAVGAAAALTCWVAIREQVAIGDRQFLRSMIPHHAGAILMCREAQVRDDEIRSLCDTIVKGQQAEIDQMKSLLARQR